MIQTQDLPIVPLPETTQTGKGFWDSLAGLSIDDALSTIANGAVSFCFKLLLAVAVFYAGRFIIRKLYSLIHKILHARHFDQSLTTFILSLANMLLYFILVITIVGILGLETSSFLAIFASAGVAIGMALSGTLQNFAGGVLILILKPYKVGDFIETQGYSGTVKAIQIFHTVINTPDNKSIIIPNGGLSTGSINNYSMEDIRRVDWTVSLAYDTDFEAAKKAILEMLASDSRVIKDFYQGDPAKTPRAPFVSIGTMAASSIDLTVRAWSLSSDYWPLYFDMNERFFAELPRKGFSFPYPQIDVHLSQPLPQN